jgi:hypothetical protein
MSLSEGMRAPGISRSMARFARFVGVLFIADIFDVVNKGSKSHFDAPPCPGNRVRWKIMLKIS